MQSIIVLLMQLHTAVNKLHNWYSGCSLDEQQYFKHYVHPLELIKLTQLYWLHEIGQHSYTQHLK
jgi:hypothetical protein